MNDIRHFLHYFQRLVQTEIQSDIDFLEAEGEEFWWYDGERIQFRSPNANHVLNALQLYPDISIARLAERIGINKSAMQKLLKTMTDKGYITRSEKDGKWHVVAVSTK